MNNCRSKCIYSHSLPVVAQVLSRLTARRPHPTRGAQPATHVDSESSEEMDLDVDQLDIDVEVEV